LNILSKKRIQLSCKTCVR